jgi:hypothetical protein
MLRGPPMAVGLKGAAPRDHLCALPQHAGDGYVLGVLVRPSRAVGLVDHLLRDLLATGDSGRLPEAVWGQGLLHGQLRPDRFAREGRTPRRPLRPAQRLDGTPIQVVPRECAYPGDAYGGLPGRCRKDGRATPRPGRRQEGSRGTAPWPSTRAPVADGRERERTRTAGRAPCGGCTWGNSERRARA